MKKFILIWDKTSEFGNVKLQDVEIVEGNTISEACNNAGIGRGSLSVMDFYDEYRGGNLTGCVVEDLDSMDSNIPQFRTIIPDFYKEKNPYEEIVHDFNYVLESTVISNPNRFKIGYCNGNILNDQLNGETFRVEVEDGSEAFQKIEVNVQFAGQTLARHLEMDQFGPNTRFKIENYKMAVPANYKIVCGKQTNGFIELVEIG